ncbi:MAG: signal peptidase I [Oscillibacter sp.]|nr:signal peptidase I [Oscillibacter sp.]
MKALRIAAKACSILFTGVLAVILACNVYTIAARHFTGALQPAVFGWSSAVVLSGSMSGAIEVDDMVLIHEKEDYAVGDIITFERSGSLITHRIVAMEEEGFITRGDANNSIDPVPVAPHQVVGRVEVVIPRVGSVIAFLRTPLGMTGLTFAGLALIGIPALIQRKEEEHA